MKAYIGVRLSPSSAGETLVEVTDTGEDADRRPLPVRLDLRNHSPAGFNWGYGGSGPAQLALAILADYLGDDFAALKLHQRFKAAEVATLDADRGWKMTSAEIEAWLAEIEYVRPTVRALLEGDEYQAGDAAIEYVEEGRGLCRAFVDEHGRRMVLLVGVGLQNRDPAESALDVPAKLVRHNGDGGDPLPAGDSVSEHHATSADRLAARRYGDEADHARAAIDASDTGDRDD